MEKLNTVWSLKSDRDPNCLKRKTCTATEAAADWLLLSLSQQVEHSSNITTKCTFFYQGFCIKSSLSFHFSMYPDKNSSKVSIKNHFIWKGKNLKTLFCFALCTGTRFHSVPNNRAQRSVCKCTLL